ncbi:MAG: hypothetical protein H6861_08465 [Rhodospirillales bacterium]|nr:hypothetical protein [candidate division KSB1 bacterium]MCB9983686.1 hypothetical protein [Rhodospirillales bacterium]
MDAIANTDKRKSFFSMFKKPGKHMFWAWIAYQTIKGTLTTSLIWIPLFWMWMGH